MNEHEEQKAQVKLSDLSDPFPIGNGVKHSCTCLTDDSVFNFCRLPAQTKTTEELITDLLFADNCALLAYTEAAPSVIHQPLCDSSQLILSDHQPEEIMYQKPPQGTYSPPKININGHPPWSGPVHLFGQHRLRWHYSNLGRGPLTCQSLQLFWSSAETCLVDLLMKTQVYKAVVLSTLICGSESRVLYCKHIQLLEHFHQWCLLSIMGMQWQDYTYHAWTTQDCQKRYGELCQGKHNRGAPRKCYRNQIKWQLLQADINPQDWETWQQTDPAGGPPQWRLPGSLRSAKW